ncbi:MAG TPA: D-alanyl-D-alanine carboxypeptidase/D-alanyl-D-alanine-endopeptidase [Thermoanaerobaculia bacterium]|nr:D-alanyl-D-alanine carboxypeptidase/D-alanyl-D-alanine-endopeptidase [Thermoanaerobaculia bacterium]
MRRALLTLCFLLIGAGARGSENPSSLSSWIDQQIQASPFAHAVWGVLVMEGDAVLHARNEGALMVPASVRKLFVAVAAAECLPPSHRIPTELRYDGTIEGETLDGNLILSGKGDPSLGGRLYPDRDRVLDPFVDELRRRGITRITGSVIGDGSFFEGDRFPEGWKIEDLGLGYAPPVDALAWNENAIGVFIRSEGCHVSLTTDPSIVNARSGASCGEGNSRVEIDPDNDVRLTGTVQAESALRIELASIADPVLYAAQALDERLRRAGLSVEGEPRAVEEGLAGELLVSIESPRLVDLLAVLLEESANLYGEMLLYQAGAGRSTISRDEALTSEETLLASQIGIPADEMEFRDGSGLSVENLVTPRAILRLVRYMAEPERRGLWEEVMATPGEGTLRRRAPELAGRLFAKTGSLGQAAALAGFVYGPGGRRRDFVLIVNNKPAGGAMSLLTSIVEQIARF